MYDNVIEILSNRIRFSVGSITVTMLKKHNFEKIYVVWESSMVLFKVAIQPYLRLASHYGLTYTVRGRNENSITIRFTSILSFWKLLVAGVWAFWFWQRTCRKWIGISWSDVGARRGYVMLRPGFSGPLIYFYFFGIPTPSKSLRKRPPIYVLVYA